MTATQNDGFTQTTASGGETTIDFDFLIYGKDDIDFYETNLSGVLRLLVRGVDYQIADSELEDPAGGEISLLAGVYPTGATAGFVFTAISGIAETRSSDFQQGGDFFSAVLNTQLDRLTRISQQLRRDIGKSLRLRNDSALSDVTIEDPEPGSLLIVGADGNIENGPTADDIEDAEENAAIATAAAAAAQSAQAAAEAAAAGMKWRPSVRAATAAVLPACTYANGSSGVGATLTGNANGALAAQDGVTLTVGQRLLVKDQASQLENGPYTLTQVGTAGTPFILTRATDGDSWAELTSQVVAVEEGTVNGDLVYICTVNQGGTIGTTAVTWTSLVVPVILASQAEAEAGVENTKTMTALRVAQAISYQSIVKASFSGRILYGLTLSNNVADATNDIDIAAGSAISDDGTKTMTYAGGTKRLDAAWAVGSGNGGLDTGVIANTTYFLWLINRPDTDVTDVLFSASSTAPTMPANYTKKKRIGIVIRESAALVKFIQTGNKFRRDPVAANNTTTATTAATITLAGIPTGIKVDAICGGNIDAPSTGVATLFSDLALTDVTPAKTSGILSIASGNAGGGGEFTVVTNTSAQVRHRSDVASRTLTVSALGWIDYQL